MRLRERERERALPIDAANIAIAANNEFRSLAFGVVLDDSARLEQAIGVVALVLIHTVHILSSL
jgi:hypothetical protein